MKKEEDVNINDKLLKPYSGSKTYFDKLVKLGVNKYGI